MGRGVEQGFASKQEKENVVRYWPEPKGKGGKILRGSSSSN